MFRLLDLSEWEIDERVLTTGRRGKDWLIDPETRQYGLFKRPHYHVSESAAEKVAAELGRVFGIPTARTDLAFRNEDHGILSYKFLEKNESLVNGGDLIIGVQPNYDRIRGREHSFQIIETLLGPRGLLPGMIDLLMLDATIGNSDRHQDNWSVVISPSGQWRLAPSYDHGSSLGRDISEDELRAGVTADRLEFYVQRGRSRVGWLEASGTRQLRHLDLLRRVASRYPRQTREAVSKIRSARWVDVQGTVESIPDEFASATRRALMCDILRLRIGHLERADGNEWR
jgi:hypothetical protein